MDLKAKESQSYYPLSRPHPLCVNKCWFYVSEETSSRNMCSNCFNRFLQSQLMDNVVKALAMLSLSDTKQTSLEENPELIDKNVEALAMLSFSDTRPSRTRLGNRCKSWNKIVGLAGFKCHCGDLFCWKHHYPTEHSCTFDYKRSDRQILIKLNPLINVDKLAGCC